MDIDLRNFEKEFPRIIYEIQQCDFLSYDLEFSGLYVELLDQVTKFDSIEDQYQKCRHLCRNHHILQFGLSTFKWDEGKYQTQCYNFFLTPPEGLQTFQTNSYKFLASQGFDFNRVFLHGLSHSKLQNQEVKKKQEKKQVYYSHQIEDCLKDLKGKIIEFEQMKDVNALTLNCKTEEIAGILIKYLQFETSTIQGSYLYNDHQIHGLNKIFVEKNKANPVLLDLKKAKSPVKLQKEENKNSDPKHLMQNIDFNTVIKGIIENRKLVIGHYSCIDMCLLYHNFIEDLPPTFLQYSQKINFYFPYLIDSKILACSFRQHFKKLNIHIEGMYKDCFLHNSILFKYNNVKVHEDMKIQFHDACFDSYVTGAFFICLANFMNNKGTNEGQLKQIAFQRIELETFKPYINKLHSMNETPFIFGAENQLSEKELSHNVTFLQNTIYYNGICDESDLKGLIYYLREYGSFELYPIDSFSGYVSFFHNLSSPIEKIINSYHMESPKICSYDKRKIFSTK